MRLVQLLLDLVSDLHGSHYDGIAPRDVLRVNEILG